MVDWSGFEFVKILRRYHQPFPKRARNVKEIAAGLEMVRERVRLNSFGDTTDHSVAFLEHFFCIFSKSLSVGVNTPLVIPTHYNHSGSQLLAPRPKAKPEIQDVDTCRQDDKDCSCPAEESEVMGEKLQQKKRFNIKRGCHLP